MKTDDVVRAVVACLSGDAELVAALGGSHVYRNGAHREKHVPSLEWLVISSRYTENTERVLIQYDTWARTYADAVAIDARVRVLLHHEAPHDFGGLLMWSLFQESRDLPDPEPSLVHRATDFLFEPAREM